MTKQFWVAYGLAAVVFCVLDFIWLGFISRDFYKSHLGSLLLTKPRLGPAAIFYLVFIFGIVYFCVLPALAAGTWSTALVSGVLFGAIAYATYDLTNLATLQGWSTAVALADLAWGAFVTAAAAVGAYLGTATLLK
jgi:uncharacterized membrane protein